MPSGCECQQANTYLLFCYEIISSLRYNFWQFLVEFEGGWWYNKNVDENNMEGDIPMRYLYASVVVLGIVSMLMPQLIALALKHQFCDQPSERKQQKQPMPLIGGLGIVIAFFAGYFLFIRSSDPKFLIVFLASMMVFLIGFVDDWYKTKGKEFAVWPRVLVQSAAIVMVYFAGIDFTGFTNPFTSTYVALPEVLSFIFTFLWIFGLTTVINWSDGMDGLAGSITAIASSTLFVVALAKNRLDSAMMSVLLAAAILGFLRYNKFPAKTYMGDSGANFIGFLLAIISLDGAFKQATVVSIVIPILVLGVPIFDNIYVVLKRILEGKPVYEADATQIHHRLADTGLSPKQVVQFLSLTSLCLSLVSIIILMLKI